MPAEPRRSNAQSSALRASRPKPATKVVANTHSDGPQSPTSPEESSDIRSGKQELIGARLRQARLRNGLGVRELSRKLGISASSVSQIELGRVAPSVSTLYALTNILSVSMDSLFVKDDAGGTPADGREGEPNATPLHVAGPGRPPAVAHEPSIIQRHDHRRAINLQRGVRWELLTPFPEAGAEFLEVWYPVGGGSGDTDEAIRHNGRDYCLILEGNLSVQIGFEQYVLAPGDSLVFDATIPHRFWNTGDVAVRAVWFVLDRWLPHGNGR